MKDLLKKILIQTLLFSSASFRSVQESHFQRSVGDTKDDLKSFLNYDFIEEQYIQEATQKLLRSYGRQIKELNEDIEVANVLFADKDAKIKESYQEVLQTYLFSEVRQVDYSEPIKSAEDINRW